MSLLARCPQRTASTSTYRTLRRRRGVCCYASYATHDPEWFRELRTELLNRRPHQTDEDLEHKHSTELRTALIDFQTRGTFNNRSSESAPVPLFDFLTRCNARVRSSEILADGTDTLHSPGEPWVRRVWAGGAVRLNPKLKLQFETPFKMLQRVSCMERIKDVRLQGVDDEAKIIVTVERSYNANGLRIAASTDKVRSKDQTEGVHGFLEEATRDEWDKVLIKEERNLVFVKAKTAAELTSIKAGELLVPRYLKAPSEPDFSHTLKPNRALLFRYSAITYNAHLLHLDTAYARDVEGHRHLLVHGPLTLTMMLLSLRKHLQNITSANRRERVDSIEYRNLAPLYCDEKMRICVKNKKRTDTESVWDVWIEGPTGGMAVKAVARCVNRVSSTESNVVEEDVKTVSQWREEKRARAARPLSYLYSRSSPLVAWAMYKTERSSKSSSSASDQMRDPTAAPFRPLYGRRWRQRQVGDKLNYLYFQNVSPLINKNEVERVPAQGESIQSKPILQVRTEDREAAPVVPSPSEQTHIRSEPPASNPVTTPPSHSLSLAERQRALLLAQPPVKNSSDAAPSLAPSEQLVRRSERDSKETREGKQRRKRLVIKKIPMTRITKLDPVGLEDAARRRGPRKSGQ